MVYVSLGVIWEIFPYCYSNLGKSGLGRMSCPIAFKMGNKLVVFIYMYIHTHTYI